MEVVLLSVCVSVCVSACTREARMGRNRVVVAVLLEHSVKVATSRHSRMGMPMGLIFLRGDRLSPSHWDKPESCRRRIASPQTQHIKNLPAPLYCTRPRSKR